MKTTALILLFLSVFYIYGCKDDDDFISNKPGTISGHVVLLAANGARMIDNSGVTIELEGIKLSTTTDSFGYWSLKKTPAGIYTIRASKDSFGYVRQIGYQFLGNGESFVDPLALGKTPTFNITFWSFTDSTNILEYEVSANNFDGSGRRAIIIVGPDSTLNPLDSSNFIWQNTSEGLFFDPANHLKGWIAPEYLYHFGFKKGNTYYVCAYGNGWFGYSPIPNGDDYFPSRYFEPKTQQYIYTSNGPKSNVLSFVLQ